MKALFKPGDRKLYEVTVEKEDTAVFHGSEVHPVCATFALARYIEWSSRLFVLDMKEEDEEGIGTRLTIDHHAPAFVNDTLQITAAVKSLVKNELICTYEVKVEDRLIASGETGQKILKKERLKQLMDSDGKGRV